MVWIIGVCVLSALGFYYVSEFCGLAALCNLFFFWGVIQTILGNSILVITGKQNMGSGMYEEPGTLVLRKSKDKTERELGRMLGMMSKLGAFDKEEMDLEEMISEIIEEEEDSTEIAMEIARFIMMDENADGEISQDEMLTSMKNEIVSDFNIDAQDDGHFKALVDEIQQYLSQPNPNAKELIEKFSNWKQPGKYDPFAKPD
jgi:Ca2+-binding EF-hand superfamily protein